MKTGFQIGPAMSSILKSCELQLGWKLLPDVRWAEVGALLTPSRANITAVLDPKGPFGPFWANRKNIRTTKPSALFGGLLC